jgi:SCP-2 sterol transfer family
MAGTGVVFGSEDWLVLWAEATAARPVVEGADGTIRVTVERAPQGRLVWLEELKAGRITAARPVGPKEPADVELTAPHPLALELWRDGLDPNVAFMQGRLKMNGDPRLWVALLPALHEPEAQAAVAALAAATEF